MRNHRFKSARLNGGRYKTCADVKSKRMGRVASRIIAGHGIPCPYEDKAQ